LHVTYQDINGDQKEVNVLGSDWPKEQNILLNLKSTKIENAELISQISPETIFEKQIENGKTFNVVIASSTLPFYFKKLGTVRAPFFVRTNEKINKEVIDVVGTVEVIRTGCDAFLPFVRQENMKIVSSTKPFRIEKRAKSGNSEAAYRIYFKTKTGTIWLSYLPNISTDCRAHSANASRSNHERSYFIIKGNPFEGYYTNGKLEKYHLSFGDHSQDDYRRYFKTRDALLNRIAEQFTVGKSYYGITESGILGKYRIKDIKKRDHYECTPGISDCWPIIEYTSVSSTGHELPYLIWSGNLSVKQARTEKCNLSIKDISSAKEHINDVIGSYYGEQSNKPVSSKKKFVYGINTSCIAFKIQNVALREFQVFATVEYSAIGESSPPPRKQELDFSFLTRNNDLYSSGANISEEGTGIPHIDQSYRIEHAFTVNDRRILILYNYNDNIESFGNGLTSLEEYIDMVVTPGSLFK